MLLDTLYLTLLLAPFAFFWCCCGVTCTYCEGTTSTTLSVLFPGLTPDNSEGSINDCEDCAVIAATVFEVPFDGSDNRCYWRLDTEYEEHFCVTPFEEFGETYDLIKFRIEVEIVDGVISCIFTAFINTTGLSVGQHTWSAAMPDHSGEPFATGPCPPQMIELTTDDGRTSVSPDLMHDACDWAIVPEVTFV